MLPFAAGRARQQAEAVFEMIGGTERMADWADKNPGEFYTKVWPKLIEKIDPRDRGSDTLEERLQRLEAADKAIDVTPRPSYHAPEAPTGAQHRPVAVVVVDDDEVRPVGMGDDDG